MKKYLLIGGLTVALALGGIVALAPSQSSAQATKTPAPEHMRSASFVVEHMTCATCPITVRTALSRVAGVRSVEVDFATKRATVIYDPEIATLEAIAAASTNAGYPAHLIKNAS